MLHETAAFLKKRFRIMRQQLFIEPDHALWPLAEAMDDQVDMEGKENG